VRLTWRPLAEASTIEKTRFREDAWNNAVAGAGERRAAKRCARGFALNLAEEGSWDRCWQQSSSKDSSMTS